MNPVNLCYAPKLMALTSGTMVRYLFVALTFWLLPSAALQVHAQATDSLPSSLRPEDRPISFFLFDYPLNLRGGYYWPGLNQSTNVTVATHQVVNTSLRKGLEPLSKKWGKVYTFGAVAAFNVIFSYLPGGTAWQHQEAHRAVLRYRNIHSYDQANDFRLFKKRIATNQVKDQDLIDFKRDHPAEFVRLRGIGHEGQLEMMELMKKDGFFYGTPGYTDAVPYLLNTYVVISYLNEFKKKGYDKAIDDRNKVEPDPKVRDISGVEFTPWVYDLFRPFELYYDTSKHYGTGVGTRGPHPYGPGVDRYVGVEDLTPDELAYLKKQSRLVWLNVLSPQTFGFTRFKAINPFNSKPMFWNFSVVHNLVSFGHVIDVNLFFQQKKVNMFFQYHNYKNRDTYFPGATLEIHRYPVKNFFLTGGVGMWMQPKQQLFMSKTGTPGGFLKLGVASKLANKLEWFVEGDVKSEGWLSGNVALESVAQFQFGLNWIY